MEELNFYKKIEEGAANCIPQHLKKSENICGRKEKEKKSCERALGNGTIFLSKATLQVTHKVMQVILHLK